MYNSELYIEECLASLSNQGLAENQYEIIVINDGSTDNSYAVVERYSAGRSNIRLINQQNAGQSAARNRGIDEAKGKYLCFVDSDDFWILNRMCYVIKYLLQNTLDILTFGIGGGNYENLKLKQNSYNLTKEPSVSPIMTGCEYIGKANYNNSPCYYFIRKDFLDRIGLRFINGRKCEDGIFTMNLFLACQKMAHLDMVVYCYVSRPNSTVTNQSPQHLQRLIDDFQFAAVKLTEIIETYKDFMNEACKARCYCRRDSYIFFLFIRLLKAKASYKQISEIMDNLRKHRLYPIGSMRLDYKAFVFRFLHGIINNSFVFHSLCWLNRNFKR